jgi:hypothetical protein
MIESTVQILRQAGIEDCKKGVFKQGMPQAYNLGWQSQSEKSEKKENEQS